MTDHFARPDAPASSQRVTELHRQAREDYACGQRERTIASLSPSYAAAVGVHVPEPSDLDVAISVAQQLIDSNEMSSLREALRLLLRALDAEPARGEGQ